MKSRVSVWVQIDSRYQGCSPKKGSGWTETKWWVDGRGSKKILMTFFSHRPQIL